jgi:hypothetical protein
VLRTVFLDYKIASCWQEADIEKVRFSLFSGEDFAYRPSRKREMYGFLPFALKTPDKFKKAKFKYLTFKKRHKSGGLLFSVFKNFVFVHYLYGHQRQKILLLKKLAFLYPASCLVVYVLHNISFSKKLLKRGATLRKKTKKFLDS